MPTDGFEAVIGLEVHVQLATASKMFCRCPNRFGAEPNTLVCPVCLGYPGALPVVNTRAVYLAVRLALALGCRVHETSAFARKSYFYPDLPKGYQITQYDRPLATGGRLPLTDHDRAVRLRRLHLEEDAGKLLHQAPGGGPLAGESLVDFNRCGVPLVEIVSEPDLATPGEAQDFLQSLHRLLLYTGTSDASMEEGSLRCDANVSLRRHGEAALGTKTEVKNLNSFRHLGRALEHEIARQGAVVSGGGRVAAETLSFDAASGVTRPLRGKEEAHDYRYFPEPDLPPLAVGAERIAALSADLPEPPWERRERFAALWALAPEDARLLTASRELADYFEAAAAAFAGGPPAALAGGGAKPIADWVKTEVLRELRERRIGVTAAIPPRRLAALVALVEAGEISHQAGRRVLTEIWAGDEEPATAVERLGLAQVADPARLAAWVEEALAAHPLEVDQFHAGREQVLGVLVGAAIERSGGRAEPRRLRELVRDALTAEA